MSNTSIRVPTRWRSPPRLFLMPNRVVTFRNWGAKFKPNLGTTIFIEHVEGTARANRA
jgi:hypothetical protein